MKPVKKQRTLQAGASLLVLAAVLVAWSVKLDAADQPLPPNTLTDAEKKAGWKLLFDGKTLNGWKASENPASFVIRDGMIVAHGQPRSHLYYTGSVNNANFKNFEFQADAKAEAGSNGGIYFHTRFLENNWPQKGCEVQINNAKKEPRKTGSLYAIQDVAESSVKDNEWFNLHIIVRGKQVIVKINGKTLVDWTQPADFQSPKNPTWSDRRLASGTFALQAHDPKSVVYYKNIRVKPLHEPRTIKPGDTSEGKDGPQTSRLPQTNRLAISSNHRYLVDAKGHPFFYLADTAWDVFMRLDRKEADEYLKKRAEQGFNVIMAILIGWKPGENEKNAYGEPPLLGKDPARPNEKYFAHVDYIVNKANSLGMFVAIAPAWSDWMYKNVRPGPHPFNPKNARSFGQYVGRRYKNNNVIWIIGGDRNPTGYEDILRAMAAGLDEGDGDSNFLMTFHGEKSGKRMPPENVYYERLGSSHLFGKEPWLDFHGAYSGHQWAYPTYRLIEQDRAMKPTRPVIDLEPCYENHPYHPDGSPYHANPRKWDGKTRGTAALIRKQAYWAILAGAAGHTYAANDVWSFYDGEKSLGKYAELYRVTTHWRKALDFPGAVQMGILRRLFESRPWYRLAPDPTVIAAGQGRGEDHIQAARADDGSFLMAYLPSGRPVTIHMNKVAGDRVQARWFNPREGTWTHIGEYPATGTRAFTPPSHGPVSDWVLVLSRMT